VSVKDRIEEKLTKAFAPSALTVTDESERHIGHPGARPGGETHFRVQIAAQAFSGKSRVDRHRMVNSVLAEELAHQIHALAIEATAPE
jgi:BolA protein